MNRRRVTFGVIAAAAGRRAGQLLPAARRYYIKRRSRRYARRRTNRELLIGKHTDMHIRKQHATARQIPLDLDPAAHLARESRLRAAYARLQLSARLSFEQMMSHPVYAIGIRNLADAAARRRRAASAR